jgi:TolB-like protein
MSETNEGSGFGQFLAEIRRRHVVRFALGYAAAAFVVLQLAEIIFPAFGVGESGLRLLVIVTALGFPPALVLAWIYDLSTEGIRRTEDQGSTPVLRRVAVAALLLSTVTVTGALGMYLARQGVLEVPTTQTVATSPASPAAWDPAQPIRSIAVLPLDDFSPGDDQAYFTSSMHEELIAKLSMLDEIRVVSRTTVMRYEGTTMAMPDIGRELDVDVIVEGSVTRTPERTRVTLQLIHAPSDSHIETLQWDRESVQDVLAFQTEIAQDVVTQVSSQHDASVMTQAAVDVDPAAQDAYFRGRYEYERGTPEGYRMAVEYFEEAIDEDPGFAPALAGLAGARFLFELEEDDLSEDALEQAHEEALSAIELDPASMEAREVLALIERSMPRVTGQAPMIPAPEDRVRQVHVLALPNGVDSIAVDVGAFDTAWVAAVTSLGERIEERVRRWEPEGDRRADQADVTREAFRARQYMSTGRYAEASRMLEDVVEEAPHMDPAWDMLARSFVGQGDLDEAVDAVEEWSESGSPGAPTAARASGLELAVEMRGSDGYWEWTLEHLEELEAQGLPPQRMEWATAHAALGNEDQAFAYLVAALERGEPGVLAIRSDPAWDELRSDPKFRELARQTQQIRYMRPRPPRDPGGK